MLDSDNTATTTPNVGHPGEPVNGFAHELPLAEVDRFGAAVAHVANRHWREHNSGPSWREVLQTAIIRELISPESADPDKYTLTVLMRRAAGRGWIVSSREARSLCAGPRYFARTDRLRAEELAETLGRTLAQAIGSFRYRHRRSPRLAELARELRAGNGHRSLRSKESIQDQVPWMTLTGWIRFEGNNIRRGPTAKSERQYRMETKRRTGPRGTTPHGRNNM